MRVPCPRRSARSAQGEGTPPSPRFPRRARSPRSRSQLPGFSRRVEPIQSKRVLPRPYAPQPPPERSAPGKPTVHDTAHRRFPPRPAAQGRSAAATARRLPSPHGFATRRRGMIAQKAPRQKARKGAFPRSLSRASAARAGAAPLRPSGSTCRIPNASLQSTHRAGASPAPQSPQPVPALSGRRDSPCQSPTACPRPAQGRPCRRKAHALPPSARNRLRPSARRIMKQAFFSRPYWTAGEKRI